MTEPTPLGADATMALRTALTEAGGDPDLAKLADAGQALFRQDGSLGNADELVRGLRRRFTDAFSGTPRTPDGRWRGRDARSLTAGEYEQAKRDLGIYGRGGL